MDEVEDDETKKLKAKSKVKKLKGTGASKRQNVSTLSWRKGAME